MKYKSSSIINLSSMHDDVIADVIIFCWRHQFIISPGGKKILLFLNEKPKNGFKKFDFFFSTGDLQKGRGHGRLGSNFEKNNFWKSCIIEKYYTSQLYDVHKKSY